MMDTAINLVSERPRGFWQKLMFKIFPYKVLEPPEPDFVQKDVLVTKTYTHFDWMDRLRILCTGKIQTWVETACETTPGRVKSESIVNVITKFPDVSF